MRQKKPSSVRQRASNELRCRNERKTKRRCFVQRASTFRQLVFWCIIYLCWHCFMLKKWLLLIALSLWWLDSWGRKTWKVRTHAVCPIPFHLLVLSLFFAKNGCCLSLCHYGDLTLSGAEKRREKWGRMLFAPSHFFISFPFSPLPLSHPSFTQLQTWRWPPVSPAWAKQKVDLVWSESPSGGSYFDSFLTQLIRSFRPHSRIYLFITWGGTLHSMLQDTKFWEACTSVPYRLRDQWISRLDETDALSFGWHSFDFHGDVYESYLESGRTFGQCNAPVIQNCLTLQLSTSMLFEWGY